MMHSRSLGGGRRLALLGAIVVIVGCLLPWFSVGGDEGEMTVRTLMAWQYPQGLVVFLAGLGTLALVALPYAMGPRPVALDRGLFFGLLAVAAVVGVVLWIWAVLPAPEGLLPTGAYGYWIAAVGSVMLCRAAFEISREPIRR